MLHLIQGDQKETRRRETPRPQQAFSKPSAGQSLKGYALEDTPDEQGQAVADPPGRSHGTKRPRLSEAAAPAPRKQQVPQLAPQLETHNRQKQKQPPAEDAAGMP